MRLKLYHGCPSREKLSLCRDACPSIEHGACWIPERISLIDEPYILDNGAYGAHIRREPWSQHEWIDALNRIDERMPREPDLAVLPDVVGDAEKTYDRSERYASRVLDRGYTAYFAVQDGMNVEESVRFARDLGCDGVFVGGTTGWKMLYQDQYRMTAHDYGIACHVGRPNLSRLEHYIESGYDSVDTTSIVRNDNYSHLERIESSETQTELPL